LALAVEAGLDVTAVHVDHGMRPGSADEAVIVAATAERLGVRFVARRVEVPDGPNLEARLRGARHEALGPDALLGHTLDDQAETVLLFLMRGTGPNGLAGMEPARRPLLALRRSETVALCADLGLVTVDDPSNDDPRFTRNRVRHELLPLMEDIAGRDVAPLIASSAQLQREVLDALDGATEGIDPLDAHAVARLAEPLAAQVLRQWWRTATGIAYAPDRAATARMVDVAFGRATAADVAAGWRIARTNQHLRLERTPTHPLEPPTAPT
jgi:tRNA(Ile)-lysidine synthase